MSKSQFFPSRPTHSTTTTPHPVTLASPGEPPLLRLASADGAYAAAVSARGAELKSLTHRGVELLATVDGESCPLLFPGVGRQRGGRWRAADGVERDMPLHGFARASVTGFADYIALGGEAGARAAGRTRAEGKDYVMRDGDVVLFHSAGAKA